ncbi:NAD-dependent epimerase/dehydratase family protein [Marinobacter caseinilyticus]|uniref:NAD-dependent epimerase/dehydratase family protein n=1 Tax=Marinobacter caseinilyticus TaxID=2692195 RepID=UPI001409DCAA|nr:NAD-dependent epimerase/dehydratase family protein [Marinobacter caseinilyticus]
MAISEQRNPPRILVAGCGALGGMIAKALCEDSDVFGLRRTASAVPSPVTPVQADLLDRQTLATAVPKRLDAIVYCLTPSSYDDAGYNDAYVTALTNLLAVVDRSTVSRLIFISSTSVFHQDDDSWVNEDSPTQPVKHSGLRILEGEQLARYSGIPATVVRFSGIYGPSRPRFLTAVRQGQMTPSQPAPFTNRIHETDACAAVVHLLRRSLQGQPVAGLYLASDSEPVRLDEVVNWVRQQTPCAEPALTARTGGRAGSKRCRNQRLLDTGFEFRYPDFRRGYLEMINARKSEPD